MRLSEALGAVITIIGVIMFFWGLAAGAMYGKIDGVNSAIFINSLYPLLLGPWLWFGEVPSALRRFVEAKIEKSALEKAGRGGA